MESLLVSIRSSILFLRLSTILVLSHSNGEMRVAQRSKLIQRDRYVATIRLWLRHSIHDCQGSVKCERLVKECSHCKPSMDSRGLENSCVLCKSIGTECPTNILESSSVILPSCVLLPSSPLPLRPRLKRAYLGECQRCQRRASRPAQDGLHSRTPLG